MYVHICTGTIIYFETLALTDDRTVFLDRSRATFVGTCGSMVSTFCYEGVKI